MLVYIFTGFDPCLHVLTDFISLSECSLASPGSPCTNLEAENCKYEWIGEQCCCGQCSDSPWLSLSCVLDPTTGAGIWQRDSICPAEGCGSEGKCRFTDPKLIVNKKSFTKDYFPKGVVTSPNYPDDYPHILDKTERIEVEDGLIISLQFNAFDVDASDPSGYCWDHLTITDGDGTTLMEKSCGFTLPAAITSTTNNVSLVFKTSFVGSRPGWSAVWSAVTPGECLDNPF